MKNNINNGDTIIGFIAGIKPYGLFIKLPNGKIGLLHRCNCKNYNYVLGKYCYDYNYCINNAIIVKIIDMYDNDNKISLEPGDWANLSYMFIDRRVNNINIPEYTDICCDVYVDNRNQYYTYRNNIIYSKDQKTIIKMVLDQSLEHIKIDKSVEFILPGAIPSNIKTIDLSDSGIKTINSWSFSNQEKLETLILPSSCNINKNAFYKCTNLKTIVFKGKEDDKLYIENDAFDECNNLEEIKNLNFDSNFLIYIGCGSSVLGQKLLKQEHEELVSKSKFSLDDIKNIIKENQMVYVKWSNRNDSIMESRICRIVNDQISVETNGYVYYIYPCQIVEILDNITSTPFPEDWFGGEDYWD